MPSRGLRNKLRALRSVPNMIDRAVETATNQYAGRSVGGTTGGSGGADALNNVLRRFSKSNPHNFPPLKERYRKWKEKRYGKQPILVRTRTLRNAVRSASRLNRKGNAWWSIIFTVPEYGLYHHEGTEDLPIRSPVQPNAEEIQAWKLAVRRSFNALRQRAARAGIVTN